MEVRSQRWELRFLEESEDVLLDCFRNCLLANLKYSVAKVGGC